MRKGKEVSRLWLRIEEESAKLETILYARYARSAQTITAPQPAQTKHERHDGWAAMPPLLTPSAHKTLHTFDISRCTALLADRLRPPVCNPSRTAYTGPNRDGISDHEMVTPEAGNQPSLC